MAEIDNGFEVVRVKDPTTGTHHTTTRVLARQLGYEVLEDHPAKDENGNWLPSKPAEPISALVAKQSARSKKTATEGN